MTQAVIATTPTGMVEAQGKLIRWVDEKLAVVAEEFRTAETILAQLRLGRMATTHVERQLTGLRRRERFYEKVKVALAAGYYIIPPFDCQLFAIRTDRVAPPENTSSIRAPRNDARIPALPAGQGKYVHPVPERGFSYDRTEKRGDKELTVNYFEDVAWKEVEFPVMALKPQLIEAASKALELRVFDALGIMPQYRAADPIIVGQIKHYKPYAAPLTFFVAWWMDYDQL